jgi:putative flippase GtrA
MVDALRLRQFGVFVAGGVLCAVVDIGLMQLLIGNGVHHTSAASAGFLAGLLVNYAFHSRVTFERAASKASFARYLCVVGVNYVLTIASVALAVSLIDNPLAGKLLSLPLVAVNGFLLSRYWIFK